MEATNEIMKQVIPILMVPINDYLRYIISCMKYVRNMDIKMTELNAARFSVEEHMMRNTSNHLEVPTYVEGWLKDVGKIMAKSEKVLSEVVSCFNLKIRHKVGKNAFNIIEEIDSVMRRHSLITWTDHPIPLGKVLDSMKASTSTPSIEHNVFRSREVTFKEALKALGSNHKGHMVALCGMGGVGKTTMMKRIKDVVEKRKMFNYIVMVVVGEKTDPIAIQKAVADYLRIDLSESTKSARADKLRKWFNDNSDGGKNKFLIILDDVWQFVDLEDIGLSTSLPNQGVNFKVLLTSRKKDICTMMGVKDNSIINVKVLEEEEAQNLFLQFVEIYDRELHQIRVDIVKKCCGLPIAIKTMALTLRYKSKDSWKDALSRLEDHETENVANEVFEMSYRNLQDEETKAIFLLCSLFPEDFDIPTEDLVRYGWGLNLFKKVYTIRKARTRLYSCIERLMDSNLLIESNYVGYIKIHDLVRDFVLDMYCKAEHASIVSHGNMHGFIENNMTDSCTAISLSCESISEFPRDLNFPNLTILKLMHGDKWLRFPQDFYKGMEKLQIISYDEMKYPLLPSSPQFSINLRVLQLHACSLRMFDFSCIGNMLNLEVLSFVDSGIDRIPLTIGNLKKLRLLDLRCSHGLCIEQSVLKNLIKLEELYIGNSSGLIDDNYNELSKRSSNLFALELEFLNNKDQMKNVSFKNLERFKISVGRRLDRYISESSHPYENTLQLVTSKGDILDSKLNELFVKTVVLCLSVDDMTDLEDVEVISSNSYQSSSLCNLRVLIVSGCAVLRYLFKLCVANTLSNLEHMEVYECDNMEEIIHNGTVGSGKETITFPKLKFLSLGRLPKLLGLCLNLNKIELPQLIDLKLKGIPGFTRIFPLETSTLFKGEVVIPKSETLQINDMENLKEIWPWELNRDEKVKLKEIEVNNCHNLVNLFPCNPMSLLHHLEELKVKNCGSIESLFNIDLDCNGAIGEEDNISSLRSIKVVNLGNLRVVWRIKGAYNSRPLVYGFQAVESISIETCERFRNVFTPSTTSFDLRALREMNIRDSGENKQNSELVESNQVQEQFLEAGVASWSLCQYAREIEIYKCDELSSVIPCYAAGQMQKLQVLTVRSCDGMKELFEKSGCDEGNGGIPRLNNVIMLPSLKILHITCCRGLEHIFTFSALASMRQLEELTITYCKALKVIVKKEEDNASSSSSKEVVVLPHLKSIVLLDLPELEGFFLGMNGFLWPSLDMVGIIDCPKMLVFAPGGSTAPQLKYIHTGLGKHTLGECGLNFHVTTAAHHQTPYPSSYGMPWSFHNLIELDVNINSYVKKIIPSSELLQLQKLEKINVFSCWEVEEVFETAFEAAGRNKNSNCSSGSGFDDTSQTTTTTLFNLRNLREMKLNYLRGLRYIWKSNQWTVFEFPNLTRVDIWGCDRLEHVFTSFMAGSLLQLQELRIENCKHIEEVIVKDASGVVEEEEERTDGKMKEIVLPHLKSLVLGSLQCLKGFSFGKEDFSFPLLDTLCIKYCPAITTFTNGNSTTPQLREIETSFGLFYAAGEDINSIIKMKQEEFKRHPY
ncbi:uncharacterized protein LOC111908482 [Lactuca sativa]|uniref:AAA+ ATPase domain-containing protein n=1 Tax=Lactuca sativa TaxID=4236 RepID=A0A9R1XQH3_LACSA|nr:uncharacterized protein LOC111908482 [Lactuca sativa]KAJ0221634.1 hypothetical protein LSAT_V11C200052410 [Lactuca sativa]